MKKINIIFLCLSIVFTFSCTKEERKISEDQTHGSKNESYFTCSMHPQVHMHEAGNCPICGMPLIKVTGGAQASDKVTHLLPSDYQKEVLNFTHGQVETRKIVFKLQASGRIMNSKQVSFYVYESDLSHIKMGHTFEGKSSASTQLIHGKIVSIDRIADPSSRAVRVIGEISGGDQFKLTEGTFFGSINSPSMSALMVPDDAVLRTGKKNIVYSINNKNEIIPHEVTLGRTQGDEVEIVNGLEEGQTISLGPNFLLDSEARLRGLDD